MDLYEILGVARDATVDQIKHTFRSKAKDTHPDRGGDGAKFTAIATAYEVLKDPERRAKYDQTGDTGAPGPENDRREALQIIEMIFSEVMNQLQDHVALVCNDLVADMRKVIVAKSGELDAEIENTRKRIGRLHKFAERFTASEGENTLAKMIEYRCNGFEKRLVGLQAGRRLQDVALTIIEHQGFIVDIDPARQAMQPLPQAGIAQGGMGMFFHR